MKTKLLAGVALAATLAFAPSAWADITIGLVAPLTGPVAAYGDQVKNGAEAAVETINKNGGILGEKVVLKLADDAGDPKQGVSAANNLVGEGVHFVVGQVTSGVAMPASDVFAENGVLMVTPTATAPWWRVRPLLDRAIYIGVDRETVRARLIRRHAEEGLFTEERNRAHIERTDLPNYDLVVRSKPRADIAIELVTSD